MPSRFVVVGLAETIAAAREAGDDIARAPLREIRRELRPMRDDARRAFTELGGTGPRTARTVTTFVGSRGVGIKMGSPSTPFAMGREFGAKRNQTRTHVRRVQSGRTITRRVGGGERRTMVARIPYSRPTIFDSWTGNQFDLGESGGRLVVTQVSGRAFIPTVGAGAEHIHEALSRVSAGYLAKFPDAQASNATARLADFLAQVGINY